MVQQKGMKFRTKLYSGYAVILFLMIIIAAVLYLNITRLVENNKWVDHTYDVIRTAEKCGALLVDMETGMRGLMIAGKDEFLEPYQRGMDSFDETWLNGKKLTDDNPAQIRLWDELKETKETWLLEVALPEITMRKEVSEGYAAAGKFESLSTRAVDRELFDEIRAQIDTIRKGFVSNKIRNGADLMLSLTIDLVNCETGQRGFLLSGIEEYLEPFSFGTLSYEKHISELKKIDYASAGINTDEVSRLEDLAERWFAKVAFPEIEARREQNKYPKKNKDVTALLESGRGKQLMDKMRNILDKLVAEEERLLAVRSGEVLTRSNATVMTVFFGVFIAVLVGCIVSFLIVSDVSRQLGSEPAVIENLAERVAEGELSMEFESLKRDATGVYSSTKIMVENLHAVVRQADALSRGDYNERIEPRSDKDELGHALARMTDTLRTVSAQNARENLLKSGQTELAEKLRGDRSVVELTGNVITFLAEYFGAQVGAFYLSVPDNMLELAAGYAYRKRNESAIRFAVGEGLVGQAAGELKPIIITKVPEDYIRVTSGLGDAVPASILVYPILLMGKLKGVIELGMLKTFSDRDLEFMNLVAESIAIALNSADSRNQMETLLDKTQQQAESLQCQQEELRQTNEELESQKLSLVESESQLQAQQEELRQTNEELQEQTQLLEEQKSAIQNKNLELENTRKIIEEKAKDLELTSKYKSEFLANMSHELRTPLNSILLLSKLLTDNKGATMSTKQEEYSQTIHSSGTELLELINEILDLSKVESGKMDVFIEGLELQEFAQRVERTFTPQAQNKNLDLKINLAKDLPVRIITDRQRLEQIIKNLISNALKFTSTGSITLDIKRPAEETELSAFGLSPQTAIAFSVIDTGEGIPEEKQKLVFEAFQQADGTTSRKYGGSGLGLSIARELARLLGGTLQLLSCPGEGSTFTVYIPEQLEKVSPSEKTETRETSASQQQPEPQPDAELKQPSLEEVFIPDDRNKLKPEDKTLLIIEDDPKFAKTLSDLAREREYKVLVAGDGETGLHFADYYKPSAVVLDIGLPGMDGWSVMARLKEQPCTRHIPVHFISAFDKSIDAKKMGAIGFITKPVSLSMIDEAFEKIEHLITDGIRELLVIEDDDVQRKAMVELIGNGDVHTTEAATGEEAYQLVRSRTFDCMILDLGLPDISGVDFLTRMKEDDSIVEIPIIVYTGKELTHKEEAIINEYAEKIIIKGVKSAEKLIDETTLFLHRIEDNLPEEKRKMIRMLHDRESVFNGKKVLVVDDDMRNVYAITNVLEEKGLEVLAAKDGRDGLKRLEEHPEINLVLMDIMMPEMNGYEAMQAIRKQGCFKNLPIIALTAKAMKGDRNKCIEAGANDYLSKPVEIDKLLSMLRVWLYG